MYYCAKFILNLYFIIAFSVLLINFKNETLTFFLKMFIGGNSIIIAGFCAAYYFKKILQK